MVSATSTYEEATIYTATSISQKEEVKQVSSDYAAEHEIFYVNKSLGENSRFEGTELETEEIYLNEEQEQVEMPVAIARRILPKPFTTEYITIRRKNMINVMLNIFELMSQKFDDEVTLVMSKTLFKNEINRYYRNFLMEGKEQNFLSLVSLYEDLILRKAPERRVVKECCAQLRGLAGNSEVTNVDYKSILRRFFDLGINVITIKEEPIEG